MREIHCYYRILYRNCKIWNPRHPSPGQCSTFILICVEYAVGPRQPLIWNEPSCQQCAPWKYRRCAVPMGNAHQTQKKTWNSILLPQQGSSFPKQWQYCLPWYSSDRGSEKLLAESSSFLPFCWWLLPPFHPTKYHIDNQSRLNLRW